MIDEIQKLCDDRYISCSVESFQDPVGCFTHWVLFVYSDEDHRDVLGKVETQIHPETAVLDLFWSVKWYSLLNPLLGVYEPLYEFDCGYGDTIGVFKTILTENLLRLERKKLQDIRKKEITEE